MPASTMQDETSTITDAKPAQLSNQIVTCKAPKTKNGSIRIEDAHPAILPIAAKAYQATGTLESAAAVIGVSDRTMDRLAARHPMEFNAAKEGLSSDLLSVASVASKKAEEMLPKAKSSLEAMTVAGIAISRALDLRGQNQPLVQVNVLGAAMAELRDLG